jgi:hypothetical protein
MSSEKLRLFKLRLSVWTVHVAVQWREELRSLRRLAAAAAMVLLA